MYVEIGLYKYPLDRELGKTNSKQVQGSRFQAIELFSGFVYEETGESQVVIFSFF